jgi:site-specific recombinase XerD
MTMQLPEICLKFFKSLEAEEDGISELTIKAYSNDLKVWLECLNMTDMSIEGFEKVTIEEFYDYIIMMKKILADTTVARRVACIKRFYRFLEEKQGMKNNPIKTLKIPGVEKKLPKYLDEFESDKLLSKAEENPGRSPERDYCILTFFLNCGIRKSELRNINIDDINGKMLTIKGKGNKQRQIPLNPACVNALEIYMKEREKIDNKALFLSEQENRISVSAITYLVKKYLNKIQKGNLSVHSLRHSCLSMLYNEDVDLVTLMELSGHSQLKTLEIYIHIANKKLQAAVNKNPIGNRKQAIRVKKEKKNKK